MESPSLLCLDWKIARVPAPRMLYVGGQQTMARSGRCLFWQIKLYWNTAKPTCLCSVCDGFCTTEAVMTSCERARIAHRARNTYYLALCRKRVPSLTPFMDNFWGCSYLCDQRNQRSIKCQRDLREKVTCPRSPSQTELEVQSAFLNPGPGLAVVSVLLQRPKSYWD